jgi:hypothetical protein
MIRAGKASLELEMASIFQRLNLDQRVLEPTITELFEPGKRFSSELNRTPERLGSSPHRIAKHAGGERRRFVASIPFRRVIVDVRRCGLRGRYEVPIDLNCLVGSAWPLRGPLLKSRFHCRAPEISRWHYPRVVRRCEPPGRVVLR